MSIGSANLCDRCSELDLESLVTAPWLDTEDGHHAKTELAAQQFEVERSVYINDFSLEDAQSPGTRCHLCMLLAECARMTGDEANLRNKQCAIRPKLGWRKKTPSQFTSTSSATAELVHTGQLYVWFHEEKRDIKRELSERARRWRNLHAAQKRGSQTSSSRPQSLAQPADEPGLRLRGLEANGEPQRSHSHNSDPPNLTALTKPTERPDPKVLTLGNNSALVLLGLGEEEYAKAIIKSAVGSWRIDIIGLALMGHRQMIEPQIDLDLVRSWFETCSGDHGHHDVSSTVSARLSSLRRKEMFKLINTSTGALVTVSSNVKYAALSYVWGTVPSHSVRSMQHGLDAYAPTLRDAAHLAKAIGIDWLWVDRVCIDQEDKEEQATHIPFIKDVFAGAELTIVAANGDGAHTGLSGTVLTPRTGEKIFGIGLDPEEKRYALLAPATHSFNTLNNESTWHTRGWTFEEFVFSRRLLYVFPTEMIFSCSTHTFRESTGIHAVPEAAGSTWGDSGVTPPSIASRLQAQFNGERSREQAVSLPDYMKAIEEYTARELSLEEDRVGAFAGLVAGAAQYDEHNISELALLRHGHPLSYFETLLTWQHVLQYDSHGPKNIQRLRSPVTVTKFAPSWSWASAGMQVQFLGAGQGRNMVSWFDYSPYKGIHILGLPRSSMVRELSPRLLVGRPDYLLRNRPWETRWAMPPSYNTSSLEKSRAQSDIAASTTSISQLHLLTVVFQAYRYYEPGVSKQMVMQPLQDQGYDIDKTENWIMAPDNMMTSNVLPSLDDRSTEKKPPIPTGIENKEVGSFCIIAGSTHMYLMALAPVSRSELPGDFPASLKAVSRLGICRTSDLGQHTELLMIMKAGNPKWEYIVIF